MLDRNQMVNTSEPSFTDWQDLATVVFGVDDIISPPQPDSEETFEFLRGIRLNARSSLEARLRQSASRISFLIQKELKGTSKSLAEVIPRLEKLGSTRTGRLAGVKAFMPKLAAYQWLSGQQSYKEAIRTLSRLAKTNPAYSGDTNEFVLLKAFLMPLILLLLQRKHSLAPAYPTKKELEDGFRDARNLLRFLTARTPIFALVIPTKSLLHYLEPYTQKLDKARKNFRKPVDDGLSLERDFRDQVIRNFFGSFGFCSLTLTSHILTLIGFPHDDRDLQRHIKTLEKVGENRSASTRLTGDTGG